MSHSATLVDAGAAAEPLARRSLTDLIVERLRGEILAGRHRAGATLPAERELASQYGVNRTSVKHALMKLEQMGLIRIRHGVGSIVVDFSHEGGIDLIEHLLVRPEGLDVGLLRDVLELRARMGGLLARLAAERGGDPAPLEALVERLETEELPAREVQALDMEFFRRLGEASGNRAIVLLLNSLATAYAHGGEAFTHAFADRRAVADGLRRIARAVRERSPARAERGAMQHLEGNNRAVLGESSARTATSRRVTKKTRREERS